MAMLTLYCDASGKEQDPLMAVAGFIAPADEWLLFEAEWNQALEEYGLRYFHMREFAHSVDQFDGWKGQEDRRQGLLNRLVNLIVNRAKFWVGACILAETYKKVDADWQLHEWLYPYPLCAFLCINVAGDWQDAHNLLDSPIEYVFEAGDDHQGQLLEVVTKEMKTAPLFRTKLQANPLQAADFAAWEILKAHRAVFSESTDKLWERFRTSFGLLRKIPCKWGPIQEDKLRALCRMRGLDKR
jgi:uncharacterized protein DUF3800